MFGEVYVLTETTVARLHGDLDMVTLDALRELMDEMCAGTSSRVVIDVSDVGFIDVPSLSVILGAADALREGGRQFMVEGASTSVRRLCALFNAEDILPPLLRVPRLAMPPAG
jgi:anti-sigma B factor antagonist